MAQPVETFKQILDVEALEVGWKARELETIRILESRGEIF